MGFLPKYQINLDYIRLSHFSILSNWHIIGIASACIPASLDNGISSAMFYQDQIVLLSKLFMLSYSEINVGYGHAMSCIFCNALTVFRHIVKATLYRSILSKMYLIALPFLPVSTLPSYKSLSCVIMRDTEDKWVFMHEWSC